MPDSRSNSRKIHFDRQEFADLINCWERRLYVTAFRILGNAADADEARQNVLLRYIEKPKRIPDSDLGAWLQRCVINESLAMIRRRKCEAKANEQHLADKTGFTHPQTNQVEQHEFCTALQDALNQLSPDTRALLSLRFDEGLSVRQIARIVNKPHTTIQHQLTSAYRVLKVKLEFLVQE